MRTKDLSQTPTALEHEREEHTRQSRLLERQAGRGPPAPQPFPWTAGLENTPHPPGSHFALGGFTRDVKSRKAKACLKADRNSICAICRALQPM